MHRVGTNGIPAISVSQCGEHPLCKQDICNLDIIFGLKLNLDMHQFKSEISVHYWFIDHVSVTKMSEFVKYSPQMLNMSHN